MNSIIQSLTKLRTQIQQAEINYYRQASSVLLLAVSKSKPASMIAEAYQAGQRHFGENYLQEALGKQQALGAFDITWHFIGPLQSNKTRAIASHFDWVHSVDKLKTAKRLSEQRPHNLAPLNICLQVNISNEPSKSGIYLNELVEQVALLPNIKLRGVMAVPAPSTSFEQQCQPYKTLYQAVKQLNKPELNTFSFGMSDDLNAAISQGATIVRIGTALFGYRQ